MDADLTELLKASHVFSSLDENAHRALLAKLTKVDLAQNEILFFQGDPSDSVYLLASGKLSATLTLLSGETKVVGYIEPGETVGELGAITNEPRSLTVKALKDSALLKLTTQDFNDVFLRYPSIMYATLQPIITRSTSLMQIVSSEKTNKYIVIVPANNTIALNELSDKLLSFAEKFSNLLIVSDYQKAFKDKFEDSLSVKEKIDELALIKKPSTKILYILSGHDTPLARVAFKKANAIYIAAFSHNKPTFDKHILDKIESRRLHLRANPSLILLHPDNTLMPKGTTKWLAKLDFDLHHHVRLNQIKDWQRLLRFIRGKAIGLVLSGGGTRAWSHVGVIKALRKLKMPIDIIGGTSAGAVVAACYAMRQSYVETYDKFYDIVTQSSGTASWKGFTWPVISLFSAKRFTKAQQQAFGELRIEDLWLPYFCISCNLTKNTEQVHRAGLVWERTRASTSVPGLIPPMVIDKELHLDGGLLNNLPVDVMRQLVGPKGKVIAVELNSLEAQASIYQFPPILTIKDVLFSKFKMGKNRYTFPPFMDTFLRGLFVSSSYKTRQNALAANVFINLELSHVKFLDPNPKRAPGLVELGYIGTMKQIHKK